MSSSNTNHLLHRVINHYLLTSASSPLIPRDRDLSFTLDNNIYPLTPHRTDTHTTRKHHIQLFINPYKRSLYVQYIYNGRYHNNRPVATQHLTITTSLPKSLILSMQSTRQLVMRTTSHTPDHGETITFPVDSVQHQMTILTLVTQILMSILVLNTSSLSWNIFRH